MPTQSTLLTSVYLVISFQTLFGLYQAWAAIVQLVEYEESTEQAAKVIDEASHRLHLTRRTLASSVVTLLVSIVSAGLFLNPDNEGVISSVWTLLLNISATSLTKLYADSFWMDKGKIPFAKGYNSALQHTANVRRTLGWLRTAWIVVAGFGVYQMTRG